MRRSGPSEQADWQVVHVHPYAPAKPAHGAPCNGCGMCCLLEPCPLGMLLSRRRQGACVALRWDEAQGRYLCGALSEPAEVLGVRWLAPLARRWIAAGIGCDARFQVQEAGAAADTIARKPPP
ncbi:hypothetical protein GCM10007320_11640 [Pseudorhodoferax aquiterrae]|uniref:4Fe-4S ferredoxin-type domain-containing protein n=1 Tax=Pseudorhodoferax aquiterrae TaxID=747304 RepID=A0ABQ3FYA5_9BURK|nr:hypothetical protein [Pseudorhodoferax aquiterrae]GHC74459.1 hypothetical protein GCM10007320_11640 [Pseudorhodoferax aquiterrae]